MVMCRLTCIAAAAKVRCMKIIIHAEYDTDTGQLFEADKHDAHDAHDARAVLTGPYTMWVEGSTDQPTRHHVENATDLADATLREIAGLIYLTVGNE